MPRTGIKEGFTKTNLARKYRDKWGMSMATKALARIMYNENNLIFTNLEDARSTLRAIEGKSGKGVRTIVTHKMPERPRNPYNLPESDEREWLPYKLEGFKNVGILSDIHVPYHSISALTCAIDHFVKIGIDCLLLNGDSLDFHGLSKYLRDPNKRSVSDELDCFAELAKALQSALKCKIIFKLGNHDERVDNYVLRKAPELFGLPEAKLQTLINNRVEGIEFVSDKRVIQANALDIIHGHEFAQSIFSPVNVARGLQLRAKTNAIQGHNHQTSEHTETNLRGEIKTTWSTGCLCELHPEYMPINKWNHGFAFLELDTNGIDFRIENYRIRKGKIL